MYPVGSRRIRTSSVLNSGANTSSRSVPRMTSRGHQCDLYWASSKHKTKPHHSQILGRTREAPHCLHRTGRYHRALVQRAEETRNPKNTAIKYHPLSGNSNSAGPTTLRKPPTTPWAPFGRSNWLTKALRICR